MPRITRSNLAVVVLAWTLASCGSNDTEPTAPTTPPATTTLAVGTIIEDTLQVGESNYYAVPAGATDCMAILSGLTGPARLASFGGDSTFRTSECLNPPDSTWPQQCSRSAGGARWFLQVEGSQLLSAASYCLLIVPDSLVGGVPDSEGSAIAPVDVQAGVVFSGQVGTRATSYYRAHGLGQGLPHMVTLFGLTGVVELYAVGCPDPHMSLKNDTRPVECGGVTDSTTDFVVDCGPFNRDGARYYVLVR